MEEKANISLCKFVKAYYLPKCKIWYSMNVVQIFRFTALFVYNIRKDRLIFETFRAMSRKQGNSDV